MNFTYLLGAGASANALPTIANFSEYIAKLKKHGFANELKFSKIIKEISWLASNTDRFTSPDTLAKTNYLKGDLDQYKRIKDIITILFVLLELSPLNKFDARYINFICSLVKGHEPIFPNNVKLLTWNYDSQIKLAANLIEQNMLIHWPDKLFRGEEKEDVSSFHLNGCSSFYNKDNGIFLEYERNQVIGWDRLIEVYEHLLNQGKNEYIKFAWEEEVNMTNLPIFHLEETEIMVIIGYSFPFFNRDIDKLIFSYMPNLKKIYVQNNDPDYKGSILHSLFDLNKREEFDDDIRNMTILPRIVDIKYVDQFFIPYEY